MVKAKKDISEGDAATQHGTSGTGATQAGAAGAQAAPPAREEKPKASDKASMSSDSASESSKVPADPVAQQPAQHSADPASEDPSKGNQAHSSVASSTSDAVEGSDQDVGKGKKDVSGHAEGPKAACLPMSASLMRICDALTPQDAPKAAKPAWKKVRTPGFSHAACLQPPSPAPCSERLAMQCVVVKDVV